MLRKFRFRGCIVDQRAPWLHHLRFIELDSTYGIPDSLKVLSATRNLQSLKINDIIIGDLSTSLPIVSLKHLTHLHFYAFPYPCATLLDHIIIPLGCSLTIEIFCYNEISLENEIQRQFLLVFDIFTHYVERYLQAHLFNTMNLNYWRNRSISIECRTMLSDECLLSISLPLYDTPGSLQVETIFNKLVSLDLTSISYCSFKVDGREVDSR